MGVRENKVENYLAEKVERHLGGQTRAWKKSNRDGVPDQIVFIPVIGKDPRIHFVEVKTEDGTLLIAQIKEHMRLRGMGVTVTTVYGTRGVNAYIEDAYWEKPIKSEYR